jgi:hypothetical protein
MGTNKTRFGTRTKHSTFGADLAGVVRLNLFHNDAFHVGFVGDEALQLEERPVANPIIHHSPSSFIPYSFEVFQNNLSTIKTFDDAFADVVINPSHITSFSSRDFLKQSLAGTSAFSLELSPEIFEFSLCLLHNTAIKEPCVACDCEVVYSEVDAQNDTLRATVLLNGINFFRECKDEKASVLPVNSENALADFPVEIFFVAGGNVELELLPILEQPQNQDISFEISTAGKVVSDTCLLDDWLSLCLLDHSAGLTDAGYCELCRQSLPEMLVNKRMELNIIPNLPTPSIIDAELQSLSISFDGSDYFISGVNLDFSTDGCSHNTCKEQQIFKTIGNEETGFLPYLKIGVSALTTL